MKFLERDRKRDDEDFNKTTMSLKILLTSSIWTQKGLNAERDTKPTESEMLENQRHKTGYLRAVVLSGCNGNGVRAGTLPPQHKWSFKMQKLFKAADETSQPCHQAYLQHTDRCISIHLKYVVLLKKKPSSDSSCSY